MPLLQIWLDLCRAHGISDVLVNTHHLSEQVTAWVRRSQSPVHVTTTYEPTLLGTAGTVRANHAFVAGEREFFVLYADNLTNVDLRQLHRFHREACAVATLGVYETHEPRSKGIVVCDDEGWVRHYEEKPARPRSNLAHAGLLVVGRDIYDYIPRDTPADFGSDVLPRLVGRARATPVSGYIRDIGSLDSYSSAQHEWTMQSPAVVEA